MKFIFSLLLPFFIVTYSMAQIVDIPDPAFKAYLIAQGIDANDDGEIQNSEAETLTEIEIDDNSISSLLGIRSFTNLKTFKHLESRVALFDMQFMPELLFFDFNAGNESVQREIRLNGCQKLRDAEIKQAFNNFSEILLLDFTDCVQLINLDMPYTLDIIIRELILKNCSNLVRLESETISITDQLDVSGCTSLRVVDLWIMSGFDLPLNFVDLPNLDTIILEVDLGNLTIRNLEALKYLSYRSYASFEESNFIVENTPMLSEVFVEHFSTGNFFLENQPELKKITLYADVNGILSFSNCQKLEDFEAYSLTCNNLNLSGCRKLKELPAFSLITGKINLTNCSSIENLQFVNDVDSLICNGMTSLKTLDCSVFSISHLEFEHCYNLENAYLEGYMSEHLDFSNCPALINLNIEGAFNLESLVLKNGTREDVIFPVIGIGNLRNVCADIDEIQIYTEQLMGVQNVVVSDNCPFVNPDRPHFISGASYLDLNGDSCKTSEQKLPFIKYRIEVEGVESRTFYSNSAGDYGYYLPEGEFNYKPEIIDDLDLFQFYPESKSVAFTDSSEVVTQDFCFISTQDLDIVDVTLIPLSEARPGFDADYRISYTNTGNIIKDGDIVLEFPNDVLDFVSSDPALSMEETGLLIWSFENLIPFETRIIDFSMNLNSPMEDPALVDGSILNYTARVSPIGNVTITSYWSYLNQEVVNSFDPNDKTCLDGNVLDESLVGESLKYMIRFENTGSAEAVNIVVIDTIDSNSFDIRSLEVLNASHEVRTEVEGDVVKFIFDDIYLPFNDENNDGYVTFRIKTLSTLDLGHEIKNRAGIYFDFNFPIITNTASTVVSEIVAVKDEVSDLKISYFPNPASMQVQVKTEDLMDKIELMTIDGQILSQFSFISPTQSYSLSLKNVMPGSYVINVYSGKYKSVGKIIVQ